jgi:hypothetical protein
MWLLTGVLTGLAIATRSAGWALALGVLMALALQARLKPMSGWLPGLVLGLLVIPYLTAGLPEARGYVDLYRDVLGSIDPAFLLGQSKVLVLGWVEIWGSVAGAMMAALLVLPGWVTRLLARRVDAWYMAISIGMLLFWPFPDHMARLLVVLVPVFVVSAHAGLELMLQRAPGKGAVNAALAALFLMTLPSGLGLTMARLAEPLEDHLSPLSRIAEANFAGYGAYFRGSGGSLLHLQ